MMKAQSNHVVAAARQLAVMTQTDKLEQQTNERDQAVKQRFNGNVGYLYLTVKRKSHSTVRDRQYSIQSG